MDLKLRVWRQAGTDAPGAFETSTPRTSAPRCRSSRCSTSINERLVAEGREPIAFDHDCREGICGSCSMMINGRAHGPSEGTATCQLHMRKFQRRRRDRRRAVAGEGVPDHPRPRRRPQRVRPHRRGRRLHQRADRQRARRQPHPRCPRKPPTRRWTPPRASAAARAWPRAPTAPPSCSPRPRSRTSACSRRASPSATSGWSTWSR